MSQPPTRPRRKAAEAHEATATPAPSAEAAAAGRARLNNLRARQIHLTNTQWDQIREEAIKQGVSNSTEMLRRIVDSYFMFLPAVDITSRRLARLESSVGDLLARLGMPPLEDFDAQRPQG